MKKCPPIAGFRELAIGLQAPYLATFTTKCRKSPAACRNIPVFGRLQPETSFDPHCVADAAVNRCRLSALNGADHSHGISRHSDLRRKPPQHLYEECGGYRFWVGSPFGHVESTHGRQFLKVPYLRNEVRARFTAFKLWQPYSRQVRFQRAGKRLDLYPHTLADDAS